MYAYEANAYVVISLSHIPEKARGRVAAHGYHTALTGISYL